LNGTSNFALVAEEWDTRPLPLRSDD
jgi:hypothetical protein